MDSQCRVLPALSGSGVGGGEVLGKVCLVIWSCMLQLLGTEKQSADSLEMRLAAGAGLFCRHHVAQPWHPARVCGEHCSQPS